MNFHHVGIATNNIEETYAWVKKYIPHAYASEVIYDPLQEAHLRLITLNDGSHIELIAGPMVEQLVAKKTTLYHSCYEVENFDIFINTFSQGPVFMISDPKPAILFNHRRVVFFMTPIGIVEILEITK